MTARVALAFRHVGLEIYMIGATPRRGVSPSLIALFERNDRIISLQLKWQRLLFCRQPGRLKQGIASTILPSSSDGALSIWQTC
jgi:hypothetical protein